MTSVPISRVLDHRKLALQRCCGVCRHFWGTSLASDGNCTRHSKPTTGRKGASACEQWERRREGLDPVPWQLPTKISGIVATAVVIDEPSDLPPELSTRPGSVRPRSPSETRSFVAELAQKGFKEREAAAVTGEKLADVRSIAMTAGTELKKDRLPRVRMTPEPKPLKVPIELKVKATKSPRVFEVNEEVKLRRERLAAFIAENGTTTAREATAALKVSLWLVRSDAKAIGVELASAPSRYSPDVRDLRERVREAFDGKRTTREIADLVGAHIRTVSGHLDALELEAPKGTPVPGGKPEERALIDARQRRVKELVSGREHSRTQIAALLNISERTLQSDMAMIGVAMPTGRPWRRGKKTATALAAMAGPELAQGTPGEPLEAMLARGADMIRIARQTSRQLNALALEIERWMQGKELRCQPH